MTIYFRDNGVLRSARRGFVRDNGVLREFRQAYARDNGVLRLVFSSLALSSFTVFSANIGGAATSTYRLESDGRVSSVTFPGGSTDYPGEWFPGWPVVGIGANYECFATLVGGVAPSSGSPLNTWLNLGSLRSWSQTSNLSGQVFSELAVSIGFAGTSTPIVTANIRLEAESEP